MKLLFVLLDGVSVGALVAISFLYVVLPLAALIFLIWFFIRQKKRNK
jgi:hypothetical protein